jgi:hypothetical protein
MEDGFMLCIYRILGKALIGLHSWIPLEEKKKGAIKVASNLF